VSLMRLPRLGVVQVGLKGNVGQARYTPLVASTSTRCNLTRSTIGEQKRFRASVPVDHQVYGGDGTIFKSDNAKDVGRKDSSQEAEDSLGE
jgi:hypothetical protein